MPLLRCIILSVRLFFIGALSNSTSHHRQALKRYLARFIHKFSPRNSRPFSWAARDFNEPCSCPKKDNPRPRYSCFRGIRISLLFIYSSGASCSSRLSSNLPYYMSSWGGCTQSTPGAPYFPYPTPTEQHDEKRGFGTFHSFFLQGFQGLAVRWRFLWIHPFHHRHSWPSSNALAWIY